MRHDPPVTVPYAASLGAQVFDPSLYPRTYRIPAGRQAFLRVVGALNFVVGIAGVGLVVLGHDAHGFWNAAAITCLLLALALVGAACFAMAGMMVVTLQPDAAEVVNPWSSRRLRRASSRPQELLDARCDPP